jgi:hypothetical protein
MHEHCALMSIPSLLAVLSADCTRRQANKIHDICGVRFPQLPGIFLAKG